jgi:hypothetical protein
MLVATPPQAEPEALSGATGAFSLALGKRRAIFTRGGVAGVSPAERVAEDPQRGARGALITLSEQWLSLALRRARLIASTPSPVRAQVLGEGSTSPSLADVIII